MMHITKYNQSCLLIKTNDKRILVDPGQIGLTEEMINDEWTKIDIILVTHRHFDHCDEGAINKIIKRDEAVLYTSSEVVNQYDLIKPHIVKTNDIIEIDDIKIEVTKAVHGFLTGMKYNKGEIKQNIGFIIDDGEVRLYITSDTINFNHDYKCDILCMPFNGNGLTMGIKDGIEFAADINPKLLLPIHTQHAVPEMNPNLNQLSDMLDDVGINYQMLNIGQSITI